MLKEFNISPYKAPKLKPVFKYELTGEEKDIRGYAEGKIIYVDAEKSLVGDKYEIYWGNKEGKIQNYLPLSSKTIVNAGEAIIISINENVMIPQGADRLLVFKIKSNLFDYNNIYQTLMLDSNKIFNSELKHKFACVSDIHINFPQGEKYWINALKEFEKNKVEYVIIDGDIGETNEDFTKYRNAVETSGYTGLIFAAIGNHEQTDNGRNCFYNNAVYDGQSKTWLALDQVSNHFKNSYKGKLCVKAFYDNMEKTRKTYYYYALIENNLYFFMDQMLAARSDTNAQDNFSKLQLDLLEQTLYKYSGKHQINESFEYEKYNLFILEHAPITQFKVGDNMNPLYGVCLSLDESYVNNNRFANILKEYNEAMWMSGHTHISYESSVCYMDKMYDASGKLTNTPLVHSIHLTSTAQPRVVVNGSIVYSTDYTSGSQAYICKQFDDRVVYEMHVLKDYTPNNPLYDETLFKNDVEPNYSYVCPLDLITHEEP